MTLSTFNPTYLGHLVVYQKATTEFPTGNGMYYYVDKRVNFEHGPFNHVFEAIGNWTEAYSTIPSREQTPQRPPFPAPSIVEQQPVPNNVIYVDFVNKRRAVAK